MRTYLKLAIKDMKRIGWMNGICILFLAGTILSVMLITSAVEIKVKDYRLIYPFIRQNGVSILPNHLAKGIADSGLIIRDEEELRDYLTEVKDIVCYEKIWEPRIDGVKQEVEAYCYSKNAIRCMNPVMREGRWFSEEDLQMEELSVVLTGNAGERFHVGDIIRIRSDMDKEVSVEARVIGIIADREKLFFNDVYRKTSSDYRDYFYVFDDEAEERILVFLSDEQILAGTKNGRFGYLNFRVSPTKGFQKQVTGISIITFKEGMEKEDINKEIDKLRELSDMRNEQDLEVIRKNSNQFLIEDLKMWLPLFACVLAFILITVIGVNTIMVKKQLGNYAIYTICGLPWADCAGLSFLVTLLDGLVAEGLVFFSLLFLKRIGMLLNSALRVGLPQISIANIVLFMIVGLTHIIPRYLVRKTSAKEVFEENREG